MGSLWSTTGKVVGLLLFVLILLLPGPVQRGPDDLPAAAQQLSAVTALMAALWLTQAIPIAATSLIPLVAFPLLGIQSADVVSKSYIDKRIFLVMGVFTIALGIEKWGLHRRMALHVVWILGTSLKRVVLGRARRLAKSYERTPESDHAFVQIDLIHFMAKRLE